MERLHIFWKSLNIPLCSRFFCCLPIVASTFSENCNLPDIHIFHLIFRWLDQGQAQKQSLDSGEFLNSSVEFGWRWPFLSICTTEKKLAHKEDVARDNNIRPWGRQRDEWGVATLVPECVHLPAPAPAPAPRYFKASIHYWEMSFSNTEGYPIRYTFCGLLHLGCFLFE